jgi:hypothetical protein
VIAAEARSKTRCYMKAAQPPATRLCIGRRRALVVDASWSAEHPGSTRLRVLRGVRLTLRYVPGDRCSRNLRSAGQFYQDGSNTRSSLRAAQAAPNPLSMLTVTTPGAQEASALCKAAVPPVATP